MEAAVLCWIAGGIFVVALVVVGIVVYALDAYWEIDKDDY